MNEVAYDGMLAVSEFCLYNACCNNMIRSNDDGGWKAQDVCRGLCGKTANSSSNAPAVARLPLPSMWLAPIQSQMDNLHSSGKAMTGQRFFLN